MYKNIYARNKTNSDYLIMNENISNMFIYYKYRISVMYSLACQQ